MALIAWAATGTLICLVMNRNCYNAFLSGWLNQKLAILLQLLAAGLQHGRCVCAAGW
jgi:uncharacterized membrane protein